MAKFAINGGIMYIFWRFCIDNAGLMWDNKIE